MRRATRVALATCASLPGWEVDDRPFHQALEQAGIDAPRVAWDDADVDWSSFDACLIRTTWDYTERRDEFVAWAERVGACTRLFNPAPIVRWNTHKSYLRDLAERGVPIIPTIWLERGTRADVGDMLAERGWRRAFIKPAIGSTARHTLRFTADREGLAAGREHLGRLLPAEDMLLQPYLDSVERGGELSAIFIDGELTHAVRKVPVPGDYRVQDDFGAHDEPITLEPGDQAAAWRAVRAVGEDLLYARADFLRDEEGRLLLSELELVEPSLFSGMGRMRRVEWWQP